MKKHHFNILCLLLIIFIMYCFTRTEGFLTIDTSQMCAVAGSGAVAGDVVCDRSSISDSGSTTAQGHLCVMPTDGSAAAYMLSDADVNMYSGTFNPGANFGCSNGYEQNDPAVPPTATECSSHGGEINLSGCVPKCPAPPSTGFNGNLPAYAPGGTSDLMGISCSSSSSIPATNACYDSDGRINHSITRSDRCNADGNHWYTGGAGVALKAVCDNSGADTGGAVLPYHIIGCEESCFSRTSQTENYFNADPTLSGEIIYIRENGQPPELISGSQDPYNVVETGLSPSIDFSVSATCRSRPINLNSGNTVTFQSPFTTTPTVQPCDFNLGDVSVSRRYSVSGCYPECSDTQRCINLQFNYEAGTAPDFTNFKEELLASYQSNTGTPLDADQESEFKENIYYYRKYRSGDQEYIEAQFRCESDNCEFMNSALLTQDATAPPSGGR